MSENNLIQSATEMRFLISLTRFKPEIRRWGELQSNTGGYHGDEDNTKDGDVFPKRWNLTTSLHNTQTQNISNISTDIRPHDINKWQKYGRK